MVLSPPSATDEDIREDLFEKSVALLNVVDDAACALLVLQILVVLTQGLRKAKEVGALFHGMLYVLVVCWMDGSAYNRHSLTAF